MGGVRRSFLPVRVAIKHHVFEGLSPHVTGMAIAISSQGVMRVMENGIKSPSLRRGHESLRSCS